MEEFNLKSLENLAVQIFELIVSFPRTMLHLIFKPRTVFETLLHREDDEQETYGDGKIGYTSPLLFAITALILQTAVDWSTSYGFSAAGMSEQALSVNIVIYAAQFLFFAFVTAVIASRTVERSGEVATLHKALYVGCYASGIGFFRTLAFTMSNWFYFFGSGARTGDNLVLILIGIACSLLALFFTVWQLGAVTYGLSIVLEIRKRTALWVIIKSGVCSIPLVIVLYLMASPIMIVSGVRLSNAWEAVAKGNYATAIEHLAFLEKVEGFEGSRDSVQFQKLQLKTYCYRRWLPKYEGMRLRVQKLRDGLTKDYDRKAAKKELKTVLDQVNMGNVSKGPMMVVTNPAVLEEKLVKQRTLITRHLLTSKAKPHWPIPHPVYLTIAITSAWPEKRQDFESFRDELDYLLLCIDVGIMTMLEHLTTVGEQLPAKAGNLEPTTAIFDPLVSMMTAVHSFKD